MKITVNKDNVKIEEFDIVHEGEHRVNKCSFSFSEEYTEELVKKAIFTSQNSSVEVAIINNECNIPTEILKARNIVLLGVYAYKVVDDKLDLRYSPSPDAFKVNSGSYIEGANESEEITPSQFEQYMQAMNDGLNKVEESIKKMDSTTSAANDLVEDISQKLENGYFIGPEGTQGVQGVPGKDGVGITTITSGQSSVEADKTITPVTVQKSDGSSQSFKVEAKNGLDGQNGQNGKDGKDGTNGQDGITPTIGENGNWYLGDTDTGKPSRGEVGPSPDLSNYVRNTDYASASKAGVLKINGNAARISSDGVLSAAEVSEEQYKTTVNSIFISKGTLDNVKNFLVESSTPVITLNNTLDNLVRKNRVSDYIISLKDALKYKVFEFLVHGKTQQETTTGKNLFDYTTVRSTSGLTTTINSDGSITTKGTPTESYIKLVLEKDYNDKLDDGETYTISQDVAGYIYLQIYAVPKDGGSTIYYASSNSQTRKEVSFTVNKSIYDYRATLQSGLIADVGEDINFTAKFQLEKGSKATEFEKYTGGQPSPNPDYPQEISTLTFDKITRCGKNLFDKDTVPDLLIYPHTDRLNSTTDNYSAIFKCLPNTTYSISKTSLSTTSLIVCGTKDYPETGDFPLNRQVYSNSNIANGYTTTEDTNYLVIRYCNPEDTLSHSEIFSTIQIEFGPQATDYEAYQATEYTIDLQGNEMVELPNDIRNKFIVDKEGNIRLIKNIGKVILDGSEDWICTASKVYTLLADINPPWCDVADVPNFICDMFIPAANDSLYSRNNCISSYISTPQYNYQKLTISKYDFNGDVDLFKSFLSTHNVIVYYPLATPEVIPLGKLTDLITTEEGSNTFFINGNLETTLEVLYARDSEKYLQQYIDDKLATLSQAVIEEG